MKSLSHRCVVIYQRWSSSFRMVEPFERGRASPNAVERPNPIVFLAGTSCPIHTYIHTYIHTLLLLPRIISIYTKQARDSHMKCKNYCHYIQISHLFSAVKYCLLCMYEKLETQCRLLLQPRILHP